jgi:hypothetical protein
VTPKLVDLRGMQQQQHEGREQLRYKETIAKLKQEHAAGGGSPYLLAGSSNKASVSKEQ